MLRVISLMLVLSFLEGERALSFSSETNSVPLKKEISAAEENQAMKEDPSSKPALPLPASVTGVAPESPFFLFRQLLKMSEEECEAAIKERPEKFQPVIRKKVKDYKKMPLQESERCLQILDLRWYLFCGTEIQKDKLDTYIASVPSDYQDIIRERLECWFSLPEQQRTNILANVKAYAFNEMRRTKRGGGNGPGHQMGSREKGPDFGMQQPPPPQHFSTNKMIDPNLPDNMGTNFPPRFPEERMGPNGMGNRNRWGKEDHFGPGPELGEKGVPFPPHFPKEGTNAEFNTNEFPPYPDVNNPNMKMRRGGNAWGADNNWGRGKGQGFGSFRDNREERMWMELNNFFSMSPKERQNVVRCLPEKNREKIWRVMKTLDELPPVERQRSLKILLEISSLPAEERATYVHSAERWKSLSSEEKVFFRILFVPGTGEPENLPVPPPVPSESKKETKK